MPLHVYNSLSHAIEPIVPIEEGHVRFYTCGPTVYNFAHIGNFRAYVFEDLLRRVLVFNGLKVTQVMNLTDVDDKTIRGANAEGLSLDVYTRPYIEAFFEDLNTLRVQPAEHYPAATKHIGEMIKLIRTLEDKGFAYRSEDGSVYFSIDKFEAYGRLARLDRSGMRSGARVAQDEYDKENAADFALWKGWTEEDGPVGWNSPWGKGRPGWHIECSAMAMKYLGESFDLHTGGVDNLFPHHEDEIAQSEAATGKPFVRTWMHCAHLMVEGSKMSKSAGNFYTLRELIDKGYSGREIRYVLLGTQYRQSLNFTFDGLAGARTALDRLDTFRLRLSELAQEASASEALPAWAESAEERFRLALNDDLNISGALAVLFDLLHSGNKALDTGACTSGDAAAVLQLWSHLDQALGVLEPDEAPVPQEILDLADQRTVARKNKDFAEADRLRNLVHEHGYEIEDTPKGPRVKRM